MCNTITVNELDNNIGEELVAVFIAATRAYQTDDFNVDVQENDILSLDSNLLEILLKDRTTGKNIMWCTDDYAELGKGYSFKDEIKPELITGSNGDVIRPRSVKSKEEQQSRTRDKAEVMTPTWICNKMNNLADEAWFGHKDAFNVENGNDWTSTLKKVEFPNPKEKGLKTWTDYIASKRMEITCGEAPYLVSRYDAVTGEAIPIDRRIGLLDRKLRIVNERVRNMKYRKRTKNRWFKLAKTAMQSIYGFEWQGDNVLLARENLLFTLIDYFKYKFDGDMMPLEWLEEFAEIISWNIWQMDGIKCVVPESCHKEEPIFEHPSLFDTKAYTVTAEKKAIKNQEVADSGELPDCEGCVKEDVQKHNGIYCKIKNWSTGKEFEYRELMK